MSHDHNDPRSEQAIEALGAAHRAIEARHDAARERLLSNLQEARAEGAVVKFPRGAEGAVVAAVCLLVATLVLFAAPRPLSAMERVSRAVERVSSFAWRLEKTYRTTAGEGRSVREVGQGRWRRETLALYAKLRVVETVGEADEPKRLVDIEEAHDADSGVLIDHRRKTYWPNEEGIDADKVPGGSPQAVIYKVRARRGRVLRHLGERTVAGREARGVVLQLDDGDPETELGPAAPETLEGQARGWDFRGVEVELWYDSRTHLPVEFYMTRRGDDFETTSRYTDLEWNLDFEEDAFELSPPASYERVDGPVLTGE